MTLDILAISDSQAAAILRYSGLEPTSNKVSANVDLSNLMFRKLKSARTLSLLSQFVCLELCWKFVTNDITLLWPDLCSHSKRKSKVNTTPVSSPRGSQRTPRRKRGGDNCDESAVTTHESSAAEVSPKKRSTNLTPR